MSEAAEEIQLYVYDLSNGMASQWGRALTGRQIDGIWHTSLVLFGMEVFYGQGIDIVSPPGTTHHGSPQKKLSMGTTYLDKATFLEYIEGMKAVYRAEKYHLLDFNCNSFTNDVLGFLNGNTIPEEIRNLPRDILSTQFGQQMRPMIDQMFSGRSGPAPPTETPTYSSAPPSITSDSQSVASNLQICTAPSSLRSILDSSPAVAVMFTSASCPPCVAIRPYFEELARTHGGKEGRVEFVLVEMGVGGGDAVAQSKEFGGPISATPTFYFFTKGGKQVGECKGADRGELKTQVELLVMEAYPPHPHSKLSLPHLTKLSKTLSPITYPAVPALPQLSAKLGSFLIDAAMTSTLQPTTKTVLTSTVITYLAKLPSPPAVSTTPLLPTFLDEWTHATEDAMNALPPNEWFPLLDLLRIGLARDLDRLALKFEYLLGTILAKVVAVPTMTKPLLLTSLKVISNALPSPVLTKGLLEPSRKEGVISLVVAGLLEQDKGVRSAAAGLAWSLAGRIVKSRTTGQSGEEGEVELVSALVEALERESESIDVVHRLAATLGLILFMSSDYEVLGSIVEVLGLEAVLEGKMEMCKQRDEVRGVLKDVKLLAV